MQPYSSSKWKDDIFPSKSFRKQAADIILFWTVNFDCWQICNPESYKDAIIFLEKWLSSSFRYSYWPRATSGPSNYFSASSSSSSSSSSAIPQFPISNWKEFNFQIGIQFPNWNLIFKLEFTFQIAIQFQKWISNFDLNR